jgi:hypothetical protein
MNIVDLSNRDGGIINSQRVVDYIFDGFCRLACVWQFDQN